MHAMRGMGQEDQRNVKPLTASRSAPPRSCLPIGRVRMTVTCESEMCADGLLQGQRGTQFKSVPCAVSMGWWARPAA